MLYRETALRVRVLEHIRPRVLALLVRTPTADAVMRTLLSASLAHTTLAVAANLQVRRIRTRFKPALNTMPFKGNNDDVSSDEQW